MSEVAERQEQLHKLGFGPMVGEIDGIPGRKYHDALTAFQTGYTYRNLLIDGYSGIHTRTAIRECLENRGLASPHFKFTEFASKGNGHIFIKRELIRRLEKVRDITGPISILSGYRDPYHNDVTVKAVPNSQHKYGNAVDPVFLKRQLTLNQAKKLRMFGGIGYKVIDGEAIVRHLDVRQFKPNTTRSSVRNPAIWRY